MGEMWQMSPLGASWILYQNKISILWFLFLTDISFTFTFIWFNYKRLVTVVLVADLVWVHWWSTNFFWTSDSVIGLPETIFPTVFRTVDCDNLISAFNKTGIYPLDRSAISEISVLPAEVFVSEDTQNNITDVLSVPENQDIEND
jgi:hypothetical protein